MLARGLAMTDFEGRDLACVRGERLVFAGLDFSLGAGGALLLLGPNGSGKSSLLRLMAGLAAPAEGGLSWGGRPVSHDPEGHRARLRYVGHLDAVKPVLSVAENLAVWISAHGGARDAVAGALERVGLAPLADAPARLLSAGQRRRLALARLFLAPAELWLLDEPTVGLDEDGVARLQASLAEHRGAGGRVVAATHTALDLPSAGRLEMGAFADRLAGDPELAAW
ncbi:MAG: heme ABC exporter ATP-binding protein CcmA [Kiloniellales bacterium]|nr:heme ABC exporter ATP-binding protein CcmA [Kiloniellales bacterium]